MGDMSQLIVTLDSFSIRPTLQLVEVDGDKRETLGATIAASNGPAATTGLDGRFILTGLPAGACMLTPQVAGSHLPFMER